MFARGAWLPRYASGHDQISYLIEVKNIITKNTYYNNYWWLQSLHNTSLRSRSKGTIWVPPDVAFIGRFYHVHIYA